MFVQEGEEIIDFFETAAEECGSLSLSSGCAGIGVVSVSHSLSLSLSLVLVRVSVGLSLSLSVSVLSELIAVVAIVYDSSQSLFLGFTNTRFWERGNSLSFFLGGVYDIFRNEVIIFLSFLGFTTFSGMTTYFQSYNVILCWLKL